MERKANQDGWHVPPSLKLSGQRRGRSAVMIFLLFPGLALLVGCQGIVGMIVLMQGFKTIPATFPGLKGNRVVVICEADLPIKLNYSSIDSELAKYIGRKFQAERIKSVNSDEVANWLDTHGNTQPVKTLGEAFEADYVVMIHLKSYGIYEENSPTLYRGRAVASIEVYNMEEDGNLVWDTEHEATYPIGHPIPVHEMRDSAFQRTFLQHLAHELSRYFYAHTPGEDVDAF